MLLYDYRTIKVKIFNEKVLIEEASSKQLIFFSAVKVIGPRISKISKLIYKRLIW